MPGAAELLSSVFGFSEFRPGQAEIVDAVMAGHNTLAIMPTGGGKSLCFQLPALC
ncbi:MAG: DEAD/DEAH box helicase, partial [Pseudomonadota bacterium]|nr:DEAD/DEAH box helicase [Pseudomonadota bacterium]